MKDEEVNNLKRYIIFLFIFVIELAVAAIVSAVAVPKVTWCHCEPNGNCQELELPQQALEQAGHSDANGNPLHAGDHAGVCEEVTPSLTPTPTIFFPCEDKCEPTVEPTATPSAEPTAVPTVQPTVVQSSGSSPTPTPEVKLEGPVGWK